MELNKMRKLHKIITLCNLITFIGIFYGCQEEKAEKKIVILSANPLAVSSTQKDGLVYYLTFENTRSTEIEGLGLKQFESICQYSITYEDFQKSFISKTEKKIPFDTASSAEVYFNTAQYNIGIDGNVVLDKFLYGTIDVVKFRKALFKSDKTTSDCTIPPRP